MRDGDRVQYSPNLSPYSYTHLKGKRGTVKYIDYESGWVYVMFDYSPQLGALPCENTELEEIHATV